MTLKEADELEIFKSTTFRENRSLAFDKTRSKIHTMKHYITVTMDRFGNVFKKAEKWIMGIK